MGQAELPQPGKTEPPDASGGDWLAAMARGDFPRAWEISDRVLASRSPAQRDDPSLPYHLRWIWDGTDPVGRDVLVRCYHGLGDSLQFLRFLPALRRRARHVTLEIQPELVPLVALLDAADRVVPFDVAAPLAPSECDLEIMELSHALRLAPEPRPYLPVPPGLVPDGFRAGLCWQTQASWKPERSISTDVIRDVIAEPMAWQSLQKGVAVGGMAPCPEALLETAQAIAGLHLVITIDTMVAHLAGAIGVPVWLLLDAEPDWRWRAGGRLASPWYGKIRKYQQARAGEWEAPLGAVRADLRRVAAKGTVIV